MDEKENAALKRLIEGIRRKEVQEPIGCAVLLLILGVCAVVSWLK